MYEIAWNTCVAMALEPPVLVNVPPAVTSQTVPLFAFVATSIRPPGVISMGPSQPSARTLANVVVGPVVPVVTSKIGAVGGPYEVALKIRPVNALPGPAEL